MQEETLRRRRRRRSCEGGIAAMRQVLTAERAPEWAPENRPPDLYVCEDQVPNKRGHVGSKHSE